MSTISAVASNIACVAATSKTVIELNTPSGVEATITGIEVSFDGVTSGAVPVLVELIFAATAGTGSAVTLVKLNRTSGQTLQTTAKSNDTIEPGTVTVAKPWRIHPQSGMLIQYPLGREPRMKQSDVLGIRITAAANVNATTSIEFEEVS